MAKRFQFDDEEDTKSISDESYIDELERRKVEQTQHVETSSLEEDKFTSEEKEDTQVVRKKKRKLEWWHYVLIGFGALIIAFVLYIFVLTNDDGPIHGNRCEGLTTTLTENQFNDVSSQMKKKYSDIQDLTFVVECKQLKVDILFKDKMNTDKAKKIAEETVKTLDKIVGKPIEKGKTYSSLFGLDQNEPQYEVNLILDSSNSKDFPIYGTKHVSKDSFSYTLSSVKDKESYDKAQSTLKE